MIELYPQHGQYDGRSREPGQDEQDWLRAEQDWLRVEQDEQDWLRAEQEIPPQ